MKSIDLASFVSQVSVDAISYNAAISACPEWQISCALLAEMKEAGGRV